MPIGIMQPGRGAAVPRGQCHVDGKVYAELIINDRHGFHGAPGQLNVKKTESTVDRSDLDYV